MDIIVMLVRLVVAAVFLAAGSAKLLDLRGTRQTIQEFGAPQWASGPLALFLPLAELAVAGLSVHPATAVWGSLSSIALLLLFVSAIGLNLLRGRKPKCRCFGQLPSEPVGWLTLLRNCALAAGSCLVLWHWHRSSSVAMPTWPGLSNAESTAILLAAVALSGIASVALLRFRTHRGLVRRIGELESEGRKSDTTAEQSGLPKGSPAPAFHLPQLFTGATVTLDTLRAEARPIVLIFADPDCNPCSALLPAIVKWEREHSALLTIVLITRGRPEANHAKLEPHRLRYVLLQKDQEIADAYHVSTTPGTVLIDPDGRIASAVAVGSGAVASLVASAARILSMGTISRPVLAGLTGREARNLISQSP